MATKLASNLKAAFSLKGSEAIRYAIPWVKINGVHIKHASIVTVEISDELQLPVFGIVSDIYLSNQNNIFLICDCYETIYFDSHYYAYRVRQNEGNIKCIAYSQLASKVTNALTVLRNLEMFVTVRNP